MKGYWNKPKETTEVLKDGILSTGDIGYVDKDGYFFITDRKKDLIIKAGENITPREIEEVLFSLVRRPEPMRSFHSAKGNSNDSSRRKKWNLLTLCRKT